MNNIEKENTQELNLNLTVGEDCVVKYLMRYDSPQREEKALEALKVGVIAILSAGPSLDTKVVEEKFSEVEGKLKNYAEEFKNNLGKDLEKYFEKEKGDIPAVLNKFFGEKGALSECMKQYFDSENGKISTLLKNELGSGSSFAKSLDPANKEGVISRIEETVQKRLTDSLEGLTKQFSLDKEDSGMSRIKKVIEGKINEIKKENEDFFAELREHLRIQQTKEEVSEQGTQKGRDFESLLYDKIAGLGNQLQDTTENVTNTIGEIQRCKVGDYLITLGETSGAPGQNIVVEAKKGQSYRWKDAVDELKTAKENRKSDCGIFVFAKGYEPVEMGDFQIDGNDFYCTVNEDDLNLNEPLMFLESAYKIARVQIVTQKRKQSSKKMDIGTIEKNIQSMLKQAESIGELITKARTVKNNGEFIETTAKSIKEDLEANIQATLELLK